jgi:hypothetical protein
MFMQVINFSIININSMLLSLNSYKGCEKMIYEILEPQLNLKVMVFNSISIKKVSLLALFILSSLSNYCQNEADKLLDNELAGLTNYTSATFKATRIVNGQSIERMPAGQLDFRIHHRFGVLNSGAYNLWGLDNASTFFSLEYGITNWIMAGAGRESAGKTFDGFFKFSILRQSTGKRNMPVSLSFYSSMDVNTLQHPEATHTYFFFNRLDFIDQILIARKFGERFSVQLSPTFLHRNFVPTTNDPNDLWALGVGGRFKLTKRMSVNAEYFYIRKPMPDQMSTTIYDPLSLGIDIETGGHVFQLIFTNSLSMTEKGFIGETSGKWSKGDIHFGFNISRVFTLSHHKK